MSDCIFCKIINGSIPCEKVYEDEGVLCFLDISPNNKGHCLVIPKRHSANLLEADDDDCKAVLKAAKLVGKSLTKTFPGSGFNLIMNNGVPANQVVFHSHLHVIPRFIGDGLDSHWRHLKYEGNEMHEFAQKIKRNIDG